jgi:hypothetical protein
MRKEYNLHAILALNKKGVAEGLEHLPVVKELRTYSRGVAWDAGGEETGVYHRLEIEN